MHDERELKQYDRWKVKRPAHYPSDLEDTKERPLHTQLPKLKTRNWRRQGNHLICDTDMGPLSQYLDPAYICLGTDDQGLPILKKVI